MGHVPSRELSKENFIVDIKSKKSGLERLVAIALTTDNFPSPNDPLFKKFVEVRNEVSVRYWYCNPDVTKTEVIPDEVDALACYAKYVVDATKIVELDLPKERWIPIPIVLVRLHQPDVVVPDGYNCDVVGYAGMRQFGADGRIGDEAIVGVFLGNKYHHEAKSLAIIEIGCKCYEYFCLKAGFTPNAIPWPTKYSHTSTLTNLPSLHMLQKVYFLATDALQQLFPAGEPEQHKQVVDDMITSDNVRVKVKIASSDVIREGSKILCARISEKRGRAPGDPMVFFMRPEGLPSTIPPVNPFLAVVNELTNAAKEKWSDSNAVIRRARERDRPPRQQNQGTPPQQQIVQLTNIPLGTTIVLCDEPFSVSGSSSNGPSGSPLSLPLRNTASLSSHSSHPSASQQSSAAHNPYGPIGAFASAMNSNASNASVSSGFAALPYFTPIQPVPSHQIWNPPNVGHVKHGSSQPMPNPYYQQQQQYYFQNPHQQYHYQQQQPLVFVDAGNSLESNNSSRNSPPLCHSVLIKDRTPIYLEVLMCDQQCHFRLSYWRDEPTLVVRSSHQPHRGYVRYDTVKRSFAVWDEQNRPTVITAHAPVLYLEEGEKLTTLDGSAERPVVVA